MNKKNLIILAATAETEDMGFYKMLLRATSNLYTKAIVLLFSTVGQLLDFLGTQQPDYTFFLLVHQSGRSTNKGEEGYEFAKELTRRCKLMQFEYTSRDGVPTFNGKKSHHTNSIPDDDFDLEWLPVNVVRDLGLGTTASPAKKTEDLREKTEFVILTALDEYENDVYRKHMDITQTVNVQIVKGRFRQTTDSTDRDYANPFVLAKQRSMGMVDAAFTVSELYHRYKPAHLIMGGVCGGRKGKVNMFDVIIPRKVYDFSFGTLEKGIFEPKALDEKMNEELITYLDTEEMKFRIKEDMRRFARPWGSQYAKHVDTVRIHLDKVMACGPWVVKTEGFLETLAKEKNNLIGGLEMESYSIGRANEFYGQTTKMLVVKSVMDYTNEIKADEKGGIAYKEIAAWMSYLCVRALMPILKEFDGENHHR